MALGKADIVAELLSFASDITCFHGSSILLIDSSHNTTFFHFGQSVLEYGPPVILIK